MKHISQCMIIQRNIFAIQHLKECLRRLSVEVILHSGTAAWGTLSTYLFDKYVSKYGGQLWSVDINPDTKRAAEPYMSSNTTLITMDSVEWVSTHKIKVDVVYLDSWDILMKKLLFMDSKNMPQLSQQLVRIHYY